MSSSDFVNESHKYKAKKDRRVQRASFREIVHSIKDGESFSETVTVGPTKFQQELILSNWALRFQYNAICHSLEQGLNTHMTYNTAVSCFQVTREPFVLGQSHYDEDLSLQLRDLFDLGPPPTSAMMKLRHVSKRPNRQTPEAKARVVARGKSRDNRAAALSYDD